MAGAAEAADSSRAPGSAGTVTNPSTALSVADRRSTEDEEAGVEHAEDEEAEEAAVIEEDAVDEEAADATDDADEPPPDTPSAAYARSPQRNPSANRPPTTSTTRSARRPAAVRTTRRAAPGRAAGQVKGDGPPMRRNEVRVMCSEVRVTSSESVRRGTDERYGRAEHSAPLNRCPILARPSRGCASPPFPMRLMSLLLDQVGRHQVDKSPVAQRCSSYS